VNWKASTRDGMENTASPAEVNGTEVVQSGTKVPYCRDERLQIGTKITKARVKRSYGHRKSFVV